LWPTSRELGTLIPIPIFMTTELRGRSAILKHEIERLENEHEVICRRIGSQHGSGPMECTHDQKLNELRLELDREVSMKRVVVFGTTHALQEKENPQNPELQRCLSYLTEKFAVTIIMEEWADYCAESLASTLANDRIDYTNVGTPSEEQFHTFENAPINYPGHDGTLGPCEDAPQFYEYGPLDKQENREQRMTQNIQNAMKDHSVGVFIVGLAHLHSMSAKLKQAGFNVAAYTWIGVGRTQNDKPS